MNLEPIDTSTTAGKARVMQLAADGRKLASRSLLPGYSWAECPAPVWDWSAGDYAIIAERIGPPEVWATVIDGYVVMDVYITEQRARELLARMEKAKRNERGHWCDARAAVDSACEIIPQLISYLTPPEGFVLVSAELLEDLASEGESGIHQTVFVPAKRERRMAFVREARALIAARSEAE